MMHLDAQAMARRVNIFSACSQYAREVGAINLSQGLPEPMMDKLFAEVLDGELHQGWLYAHPKGTDRLREAIATQLYGSHISASDVLVTSGCTESLYVALRALRGSFATSVGFFEPFYPYYLGLSQLADLHPLPIAMVRNEAGFEPDWQDLEERLRCGLDVLLLNTPHNPTGWVLTESQAAKIRDLANRHGTFLLIDEAYKSFVYDGLAQGGVDILLKDNERCLVAGSFSKLLSAPGLRVGWLVGISKVLELAATIHTHITYCQPPVLQSLAARVLETRSNSGVAETVRHYAAKRTLLLQGLLAIGLRCFKPSGGHFVMAEYSALADLASESFCRKFASVWGVMPLPGSPFFSDPAAVMQVRFSFAVEMRAIEAAVTRFGEKAIAYHDSI
jgi:N-succinyldiaminopimelate aminotransferase